MGADSPAVLLEPLLSSLGFDQEPWERMPAGHLVRLESDAASRVDRNGGACGGTGRGVSMANPDIHDTLVRARGAGSPRHRRRSSEASSRPARPGGHGGSMKELALVLVPLLLLLRARARFQDVVVHPSHQLGRQLGQPSSNRLVVGILQLRHPLGALQLFLLAHLDHEPQCSSPSAGSSLAQDPCPPCVALPSLCGSLGPSSWADSSPALHSASPPADDLSARTPWYDTPVGKSTLRKTRWTCLGFSSIGLLSAAALIGTSSHSLSLSRRLPLKAES